MKRSRLGRKTPLKSKTPLRKTRLRAVSTKRRKRDADRAARASLEAAQFKARVLGERCVACGRSEDEAFAATGFGHQAHHGVPQAVLKRLGLDHLLWRPGNAVCVCEEPCHRRHTDRVERIPFGLLPARTIVFAREHGLERELRAEYR